MLRTLYRIYRKEVKTHLQLSMRKTQVEQILLLMIESGFIYCGIWVSTLLRVDCSILKFHTDTIPQFCPHRLPINPQDSWYITCCPNCWWLDAVYCGEWTFLYIMLEHLPRSAYLFFYHNLGCRTSKVFSLFHNQRVDHSVRFSSYNIHSTGSQRAG